MIKVIYNYKYDQRCKHMSKIKYNNYIHPCVNNIGVKNIPTCFHYSSKPIEYISKPKLMFGLMKSGIYLDLIGEYGCCQGVSYIFDTPNNLIKMKEKMLSKDFIELMGCCDIGSNGDIYNRKVISLFKNNFWEKI